MKRKLLGEIDQLVGFSYYSFKNQKFRRLHPTDIIKGAIIAWNSDGTLEDLISPYSLDELENALEKSGRKQVLNSKVMEVMPCENIRFSKEYGGVVGSMSFKDVPIHSVEIRGAHDFEKFELTCDCSKHKKRRFPSGVWFPAILKDWNLEEKHYSETTCPHICAIDFSLRKIAGVKPLGLNDRLEFMKPYVLSFIDVVSRFPDLKDYTLDFAYTYYSSMFDNAKKQVNEMRRRNGLGEQRMYSNPYLRRYIRNRMGISERTMEKIIEIVGY
jgi:hypothetical protein